jgi:hypothetical protein
VRLAVWAKGHRALVLVLFVVVGWVIYRWASGKQVAGAGHSTPADAISYGWVVYQAGITGWMETSPDGSQAIYHDTGWTGSPYAVAS